MSDITHTLEQAKSVTMSEQDRAEQRQSFVYGNTHIENEQVTRDIVREVAAEMVAQHGKR